MSWNPIFYMLFICIRTYVSLGYIATPLRLTTSLLLFIFYDRSKFDNWMICFLQLPYADHLLFNHISNMCLKFTKSNENDPGVMDLLISLTHFSSRVSSKNFFTMSFRVGCRCIWEGVTIIFLMHCSWCWWMLNDNWQECKRCHLT